MGFVWIIITSNFFQSKKGITETFFKTPISYAIPTFGITKSSFLIEFQVVEIINFFGLIFLFLTIITRFPVTQTMIIYKYNNKIPRIEQSKFKNGFSFRSLNSHLNSYHSFSIFLIMALFGKLGNIDSQFFGNSILIYFFSRLIYHLSCLFNFQILEIISNSICFVTLTNLIGSLCFVITLVFKKFE